jgi:hypothetical protein
LTRQLEEIRDLVGVLPKFLTSLLDGYEQTAAENADLGEALREALEHVEDEPTRERLTEVIRRQGRCLDGQ